MHVLEDDVQLIDLNQNDVDQGAIISVSVRAVGALSNARDQNDVEMVQLIESFL